MFITLEGPEGSGKTTVSKRIIEILKAKGYKVISDVHLGDIGLQMGQVIYGLKQKGLNEKENES